MRFCISPGLEVGYTDFQEDSYYIETLYSWFTVLHEFVHILLAQLEFPEEDDERVAYVIPAGVYYSYKYYGRKLVTT